MAKRIQRIKPAQKRRTTLTLPAESLAQASAIARARNVNLSTVVSEALADGLRHKAMLERGEEVLASYRKAFSGFTDEELLILDGVMLEPTGKR